MPYLGLAGLTFSKNETEIDSMKNQIFKGQTIKSLPMQILVLVLFFTINFSVASAQDLTIAFVKRDIPLSDSEPLFTDYYISSNENLKLKKNQTMTVVRSVSVRDQSGTQTLGNLEIPVGQLKIMDVQGKIAVARETKLISRDERPLLDQPGFLVGDKVVP